MTTPQNGGPAFPCINPKYDGNWNKEPIIQGLTVRDYMAAHAPEQPQDWFEPVMPPCPKVAGFEGKDGAKYVSRQKFYDKEGQEAEWALPTNWEEINEWEKERHKQKLLQWPYAWADEMIKRRGM